MLQAFVWIAYHEVTQLVTDIGDDADLPADLFARRKYFPACGFRLHAKLPKVCA